jgi:hypothetical protein
MVNFIAYYNINLKIIIEEESDHELTGWKAFLSWGLKIKRGAIVRLHLFFDIFIC